MAEKKPEAPAEEGAEAPKSKKKLIMFIVIGVVVLTLIIGGVVGYLMLKKAPADEEDPDAAENTEQVDKAKSKKKSKEKDVHAAPTFFKFDKPFTVKLQSADNTDSYLQVEVQFKVLDPTQVDHIKAFDAELKHKITLLLLGKTAADLSSSQGVQRLSNQVRDVANHTIEGHNAKGKNKDAGHETEPKDEADPEAPVQAVLFTTFIIQ